MISKSRFYTDFRDKAGVELYIGQGSGRQLGTEIRGAQKEVWIVSPYIDETSIDELIVLKERGVRVHLLFSELRQEQYYSVLRRLLERSRNLVTSELPPPLKKQKINWVVIFWVIFFLCFLMALLTVEIEGRLKLWTSVLLMVSFFIACVAEKYIKTVPRSACTRTDVYEYHYRPKIDFKFVRRSGYSDLFIHSKIYIIDDRVAYVGSMNFTNRGFTRNFETRVRITDVEKVKELTAFVRGLWTDSDIGYHDIRYLGRKAYEER